MPILCAKKTTILDINTQNHFLAYSGYPQIIKTASIPSLSKSDSRTETQYVVLVFRDKIRWLAEDHVDIVKKFPFSFEQIDDLP